MPCCLSDNLPFVLAADRTHTLQLGASATVSDVKCVIEARQGEHFGLRSILQKTQLV